MFRYVAISWNPEDVQHAELSESAHRRLLAKSQVVWRTVFSAPGLRVLCSGDRPREFAPHLLEDETGVVLGTLFRQSDGLSGGPAFPIDAFEPAAARRITSTEGRDLVQSYWGCYVAFIVDRRHKKKLVIRGPVSDLTCYSAESQGVRFFFSRIEDCTALGVFKFSINWLYLKVHVAYLEPRTLQTAINEVSAVEGGECVDISGGELKRTFYWHPCLIAKSDRISDMSAALEAMLKTTRRVIHAWASCYDRILLRLSGGVDSAIVLACLRSAPTTPTVTCQNWYSPGATGDERMYARDAARLAGYDLVEREREPNLRLEVFRTLGPSASPMRHYSAYECHLPEALLASSLGATAVFCGGAGDSLFEQGIDERIASDYVAQHGWTPGLFRVARNIGLRNRISVWRVLRAALAHESVPRRGEALWHDYLYRTAEQGGGSYKGLACDALVEEIAPSLERFVHPWYLKADGVPEKKLWMISALTAEMCYDAPFSSDDGPLIVSPLCSQPLVEVCLRVESHLNAEGGWDRAVARRAFALELPESILRRTSKGGPDVWAAEVIKRNMDFIREYLLGGVLIQKGLLDAKKLASGLAKKPTKVPFRKGDVIRQLYNEAWTRVFLDSAQAA